MEFFDESEKVLRKILEQISGVINDSPLKKNMVFARLSAVGKALQKKVSKIVLP